MKPNCCKNCGEITADLKELKTVYGKTYYCRDCYDDYMQEKHDKDDLVKYICKKQGLFELNGHISKHIMELHNDQGYSYRLIKFIVHYYHDIEKLYNPKYCYTINGMDRYIDNAISFLEMNNIDFETYNYKNNKKERA